MDRTLVTDIITRIKDTKVCVIGDVMLDKYSYGSVDRISPEAPVPIMQINREELVPGGAANVFANIQALGATVALVGVVGDDADGKILTTMCESLALGSSTATLIALADRKTTVKHRLVAMTQQVLRVDTEDTKSVSADQSVMVWQLLKFILKDMDAIAIADYGKGTLSALMITNIMAYAKAQQIPVIVDTKPKQFELYKGATIFAPNEKETTQLFPNLSYEEAGEALARLCDSHILSTRGGKGMQFFPRPGSSEQGFSLPAYPAEVRDVSGAGDTVSAVLSVSLAQKADYKTAAELSNRAAAVVVAKPHTAIVSAAELLEIGLRP